MLNLRIILRIKLGTKFGTIDVSDQRQYLDHFLSRELHRDDAAKDLGEGHRLLPLG